MYVFTEGEVSLAGAHWVQDTAEAQRGKCRWANAVFLFFFPVLKKLPVHCPAHDPVQTY